MEKNNNKMEFVGFIKKTELISTIKKNIIPGSWVVEALEPFPGYHGDDPRTIEQPGYVFLMTKEFFSAEKIARFTQSIKRYFSKPFDSHYGTLRFHNEFHPCIRLKNMESFNYLEDIMVCFRELNVQYRKLQKLKVDGIFKFQKYFCVEQFNEPHYYKDIEQPKITYFEVPYYPKWKLFEEITKTVKNNVDNNDFDAALASFYCKDGLKDLVRIYSELSFEQQKAIREKYLTVMQKYV